MILALDIATTTGWAVRLPGGAIKSGSHNMRLNRTKDVRYILFEVTAFMNAIQSLYGTPDAIAFEQVKRHMGWRAAQRYWSLLSSVERWTVDEGRFVPMLPLQIHDIKIHATGRGNASKAEMMQAGRARGWKFQDDNEADALFILDLAVKEIKERES